MIDSKAISALKRIVNDLGEVSLIEAGRVRGLLLDAQLPSGDVRALVCALEDGQISQLRTATDGNLAVQRLSRRLVDNWALSEVKAEWAINTWLAIVAPHLVLAIVPPSPERHVMPVQSRTVPDNSSFSKPSSEQSQRPFPRMIGQSGPREILEIAFTAAGQRDECAEPFAIIGSEGSGRHTLLKWAAEQYDLGLQYLDLGKVRLQNEITVVLTNVVTGNLIVVDNVRSASPRLREAVLDVVRTGKLTMTIGEGSSHPSSHTFKLQKHTFAFVVEKRSELPSELRGCVSLSIDMEPYSRDDLIQLIESWVSNQQFVLSKTAQEVLVSKFTKPRELDRVLRRIRDYAQVKGRYAMGEEDIQILLSTCSMAD